MELNQWCVVFVILCFNALYAVAQYEFPSSPCPKIFQYQNYNGEWIGIADIPLLNPEQIAKVEIVMAGSTKLPQERVASLELIGSEEMAIQEIRLGRPAKYMVRYPKINTFLSKLTQITVDERVVCSVAAETGDFVTQIRLQPTQKPIEDNFQPSPLSSTQYKSTTQAYSEKIQLRSQPQIDPKENQQYNSSQLDSEICGRITLEDSDIRFGEDSFLLRGASLVLPGQIPWLVAVFLNSEIGPTFICSGSLVSRKVVVTAASCFRQPQRTYSADDIVLDFGHYELSRLDKEYKLVKAQQLIVHNDYMSRDHTFDADLALVITKESVHYTDYIRPICLWEGLTNLEKLETGTVYGYGQFSIYNKSTAAQEEIDMPIVSQEECLRSNEIYREIISARTFCAGERDGRGPCYGNSGSGMMMYRNGKSMLRGFVITSLTNDRYFHCDLKSYVVFTDVTKFIDWIKSVISSV